MSEEESNKRIKGANEYILFTIFLVNTKEKKIALIVTGFCILSKIITCTTENTY